MAVTALAALVLRQRRGRRQTQRRAPLSSPHLVVLVQAGPETVSAIPRTTSPRVRTTRETAARPRASRPPIPADTTDTTVSTQPSATRRPKRPLVPSCTSTRSCLGRTHARTAARTTTTLRRSTVLVRMRKSPRFVPTSAGSAAPIRPERARGRGRTAPRGTTRTGIPMSPIMLIVVKIFYKYMLGIPPAVGTTEVHMEVHLRKRSCAVQGHRRRPQRQ